MPQIGTFIRETSAFTGHIRTLSFDINVVIVPADAKASDTAPDYRIYLTDESGPEIGAGWRHKGERAGDYVAIIIDDPVFLAPIRANLFCDGDTGDGWALHWSRQSRRAGKD